MPPHRPKLALTAAFLAFTAFAITSTTLPSLVTTIAREMKVPDERFGYIFSLQFICFAAASIVGGRVRRRLGLTDRALVIAGILTLTIAFAASHLVSNFLSIVLWIIPVGLAGGLTETFCAIMVAKLDGPHSSKLLNFGQVFFCAGAVTAPYLAGLMLAGDIPWRGILLILSSFLLVVGLFFVGATRTVTATPSLPVNPPTAPAGSSKSSFHCDPIFILLATAMFLYVTIELAAASWLATYFEHTYDLSAADAAWRPGLFWFGVMVGRTSLLFLPHRWTVWPAAIFGPVGMILGAVLIVVSPSPLTASAAVLLYGLGAGPLWPVIVTIGHNHRQSTRFTADIIAVGAFGAAAGPFFAGWIMARDRSLLFPILALGAVTLLLTTLATKKTLTRQNNT